MTTVNILDAKNSLSRLIADALDGEEVIIANRGKPVVRLVPIETGEEKSTGAALSKWFAENPLIGKASASFDDRIREIREGWE